MKRIAQPLTLAVLAAVAVLAAGCGSSSGGGSSAPAASTAPAPSGGTVVDVTLKDFSITLAGGTALKPGTYTLHVTNQGPSSHNLTVEGPGVNDAATPTFAPGSQDLTVTLKDGTYQFYCSVPGHKALGMDVSVKVGSGGAAGSAGGNSSASTGSGGGWG